MKILHIVQTLYPFSSVTEEELNFEKGETMEVIEKPENDPEWWKCKNSRGQIGLVPKNYVVIVSDGRKVCVFKNLCLGKTKRKTSARDASPTPSTDAEYPSNGSSADRIYDLNIPAYVKFAYMAERDDELSLVKGSRVIVMEKCSDVLSLKKSSILKKVKLWK
uniref:NCK adaptor protein 2 n=1 Tax=Naja naja TaxID=35670 RepID=A0A8C6XF68_NAJNA